MTNPMLKNLLITFICLLVSSCALAQPGDPDGMPGKSVVILFRHGEVNPPPYTDNPPNPNLNEIGKERAQLLTSLVKNAGVTKIYCTDLNRTKETVELIRQLFGLEFTFYGVKDMGAIAEEMKSTPGVYLVSGHSNTTPDMVRLLGGEPGEPIDENEFDRLYIVTIIKGSGSSVMLRYGKPYTK